MMFHISDVVSMSQVTRPSAVVQYRTQTNNKENHQEPLMWKTFESRMPDALGLSYFKYKNHLIHQITPHYTPTARTR